MEIQATEQKLALIPGFQKNSVWTVGSLENGFPSREINPSLEFSLPQVTTYLERTWQPTWPWCIDRLTQSRSQGTLYNDTSGSTGNNGGGRKSDFSPSQQGDQLLCAYWILGMFIPFYHISCWNERLNRNTNQTPSLYCSLGHITLLHYFLVIPHCPIPLLGRYILHQMGSSLNISSLPSEPSLILTVISHKESLPSEAVQLIK